MKPAETDKLVHPADADNPDPEHGPDAADEVPRARRPLNEAPSSRLRSTPLPPGDE
ncbi:MAG: hypothetical protein HOV86_02345 [Thermoactinospora sp.]|nr:hypothetical protein [Thermoactinospora sp.]